MLTRLSFLATLSVVFLSACQSAEPPKEKGATGELEGSYEITAAESPKGTPYDGSVKVEQEGDRYTVDWKVGRSSYSGIAIERDDVLGAAWGSGDGYGVVVYRIDGGTLHGLWAMAGHPKLGSEKLVGDAGLSGQYTIEKSYSPIAQKGYRGVVDISEKGDTYELSWQLNNGESYAGLGVKQDDYLVVAWENSAAGVVAYEIDDDTLDGTWAERKGDTGTEELEAK